MKTHRVGNPGKTAVYIALSLLIHAAVFFGAGGRPEDGAGDPKIGPFRVRSLSFSESDEPQETPAPEAVPPQAAPSRPSSASGASTPSADSPPSETPPSPDPDPSPGPEPSEAVNKIEQALGGWDPAAGLKSEESGRSEAASAESGTVREVPFAELNGSGLELPDYPELARRWGWEGIVVVRIQIGPEGNVREAELLRSSGYDLLDRAALKTVAESWTFNPPGREVETVKEFEFLLKSAR